MEKRGAGTTQAKVTSAIAEAGKLSGAEKETKAIAEKAT
jgi:hypothetical protein